MKSYWQLLNVVLHILCWQFSTAWPWHKMIPTVDTKWETGYRKSKTAREHLHSHLVSHSVKSCFLMNLISFPWWHCNSYKPGLKQPWSRLAVTFQLSYREMPCCGISGWTKLQGASEWRDLVWIEESLQVHSLPRNSGNASVTTHPACQAGWSNEY